MLRSWGALNWTTSEKISGDTVCEDSHTPKRQCGQKFKMASNTENEDMKDEDTMREINLEKEYRKLGNSDGLTGKELSEFVEKKVQAAIARRERIAE